MSAAALAGRGAVALATPPLRSPGSPQPPRAVGGFVPRLVGPGCIVASCASLQTAAALATTVFATFGPAGTGALRFLAAAVVLLAAVRPRLRDRPTSFWWSVATLGAATAATNVLLYESIARIPLGTAGTLVFLGPFALALLGTRRRLDIAWACAALAGVVLLTGLSTVASPLGVAFALGAAGSVAASILLARRVGQQAERLDGLALSIAAAALITLPLSLGAAVRAAGPLDIPVVAAVGVLGIAIPYALEFSALRRVGTRTYSILLSLDPAIAALAGLLFLGQQLDASGMLGMALVIGAGSGSVATRRLRPARRR
jgi:inner membrane transporter RhtA